MGGTSKSSDQTSILGDLVGIFYSTHVVENRWVQKKFRPNHEFRRLSRNFLLFLTFRGLEQMLAGGQIPPNFQKVPTKLCILTIWSELFVFPLYFRFLTLPAASSGARAPHQTAPRRPQRLSAPHTLGPRRTPLPAASSGARGTHHTRPELLTKTIRGTSRHPPDQPLYRSIVSVLVHTLHMIKYTLP